MPRSIPTSIPFDRGVASSDRLLDGYCQLHRLLLAFTSRYPQLRTSTSARVVPSTGGSVVATDETLEQSAVSVATTRLDPDSCSHPGDLYCGPHGTGSVDWSMRVPACRETMSLTQPLKTTLTRPS